MNYLLTNSLLKAAVSLSKPAVAILSLYFEDISVTRCSWKKTNKRIPSIYLNKVVIPSCTIPPHYFPWPLSYVVIRDSAVLCHPPLAK